MNRNSIVLISVVCFFLFITFLLLNYPPIWPDETWYADIGLSFLRTGRFSNSLLGGIAGSGSAPTLYPPGIYILYALFFSIGGVAPLVPRIFAVISAIGIFFILFKWLTSLHKETTATLSILLLLVAIDFYFLRASHFGRPEIYILLLHSISYYLVLRYKSRIAFFMAGVLVGLSVLLQAYGIIAGVVIGLYLLLGSRTVKEKIICLAVFSLPILICIAWWMYLVKDVFSLFLEGMNLHGVRKSLEPSYFAYTYRYPEKWMFTITLLQIGTSVYSLWYLFSYRIPYRLFYAIVIATSWVFIIIGRQYWYAVYLIPFIYIPLVLAYGKRKNLSSITRTITYIFILLLFVVHAWALSSLLSRYVNGGNYWLYSNSIRKHIPKGSTVMISSIPDPYYALIKDGDTLYQFIGLPDYKKHYKSLLEKSDYVVFNGSYDMVYGTFLTDYLEKHKKRVVEVDNGPNEYKGYIIEL